MNGTLDGGILTALLAVHFTQQLSSCVAMPSMTSAIVRSPNSITRRRRGNTWPGWHGIAETHTHTHSCQRRYGRWSGCDNAEWDERVYCAIHAINVASQITWLDRRTRKGLLH